MLAFLKRVLAALARRQVERCAAVKVAKTARVNWRGIRRRPPAVLEIGEGSIFEGTIASDREGSCVVIGSHTFIGNSMIVTAERVEIGNDVLISWGCTIVDHDSHNLDWAGRTNDVRAFYEGTKHWEGITVRPVKICDRAWIGFNVIILKGVTIGANAVVAAGSVVTKSVAPFTVVGGNPARVIRVLEHVSQ